MTAADILDKARWVLDTEISQLQSLRNGLDKSFVDAVGILRETVLAQRKVVVIGVGKCENIATKIVATFNSTGTPAVKLSCQNALHGDLGIVAGGDAVVALSQSGETAEMLALLPHLRRREVKVITITGKTASTLAKRSDVVIDNGARKEACPLGLAPTSSSTNTLVVGDALAMVLLESRNFRSEDFAALHPAGSLGNQLFTKVSDIMRQGSALALVRPEETVEVALAAMQKARSGAAVVVRPDETLAGIFTHGDFVRRYRDDRNIADKTLAEVMSPEPVTIDASSLAVVLLEMLKTHKVDDIIVLDEKGAVTGIVDTQDLSRHKLV